MKVILIKENGDVSVEIVKNERVMQYGSEVYTGFDECKKLIGTDMGQVIAINPALYGEGLDESCRIICDEEACFKDDLSPNVLATALYFGGLIVPQPVMGHVVLFNYGKYGTVKGFSDEQLYKVFNRVKDLKSKIEPYVDFGNDSKEV